jgi:hypothetical protein
MTAFAPLLGLLEAVPDPRRAEGKVYPLPHVLLFSILAIVSGGNSYRSVATFIDVHRQRLNRTFGLTWRRAPAHTSIRNILQGLDSHALEAVFRLGILALQHLNRTVQVSASTGQQHPEPGRPQQRPPGRRHQMSDSYTLQIRQGRGTGGRA